MEKSPLKSYLKFCAGIVAAILFLGLWITDKAAIHVFNYTSVNTTFTFSCIPAKGIKLEEMLEAKTQFEKENNTQVDICRAFSKNYLKFWKWRYYSISPYYKFPRCEVE